MSNFTPSFFMGALTAEGYYSNLKNIYDPAKGWRAYLIKGGPGMGKSSLMKGVVADLAEKGFDWVAVPCPSDPDSLDGVIFPAAKVAIMDATHPHIVDPQFPQLSEVTVELGHYCRKELIAPHRDALMAAAKENKALYDRAYRYIAAASSLMDDTYRLAARHTDMQSGAELGNRLANQLIPQRSQQSDEKVAFLSGITSKGHIFMGDTIDSLCSRVVVFQDELGAASRAFMSAVRFAALSRGHRIITCMCPFAPNEKPEHILVPELDLAFTTQNRYLPQSRSVRRIHARRFSSPSGLAACRQRFAFNRRGAAELIKEACLSVEAAKKIHDDIEGYYILSMDFDKAQQWRKKIVSEILAEPQN